MSARRNKFLVLLIAAANPSRLTLASLLEDNGLATKSCDSVARGLQTYFKAPQFDLVIVDYRLGAEAAALISKLNRDRRAMPIVAINAPLRAEAEAFQTGASCALGPGYSPRSLALQCRNLILLVGGEKSPEPARPKAQQDFSFGNAVISPEYRTLRSGHDSEAPIHSPLTVSQIRILSVLKSAPGRILDYEFLCHAVWRRPYNGNNGAIREALSSIRKQFGRQGMDFGRWVATVRGQGYRYDGL